MAEGFATATANAILNAIFNATAYSEAEVWFQLHTAAPGAAGTTAVATNSTRKQISSGAAASGAITSDAVVEWLSVAAAEDYTHCTVWDAETDGNFVLSGTITANAVGIGDDFRLPIGDIDFSIPVAS